MNFKTIEYDDLDDMEAGELRELVQKFSDAQAANQETFEEVTETVEEFDEHDSKLTEKVAEKTSLSEESSSALSYSDKRALLDDLKDTSEEEDFDEEDDEEGQEFEDHGTRGRTHEEDEDGTPEHVEKAFKNISGIQL